MIRPLHVNPRRGYSLTVVLLFLILMLALWGTVYRTTSSVLRVETNRVSQQSLDPGALNALAQAVQLLQYVKLSVPNPPSGTHYTYDVNVTVPNSDGTCGNPPATLDYTIVYTYSPLTGSPADPNRWLVEVSPGNPPATLPAIASPILWVPTP
jgi:hypothetical protein